MPSLTIRDIPPELLDRIRTLSARERRSMNSEILILLEDGIQKGLSQSPEINRISKTTQLGIWEMLAGRWADSRSTGKIVEDIYASRTPGRDVGQW